MESTGNVFDKSLTDVYTMGVDQKGKITVDITPGDIEDNSFYLEDIERMSLYLRSRRDISHSPPMEELLITRI